MTSYRTVWTRFWAAVVVACVGLAAVAWGPARTAAFFVVVAISTLAPAICYFRERVRQDTPTDLWWATARVAVTAGAVGVAVVAMINLFGPIAVLTLLVAFTSSPWVVAGLRRLLSRRRGGAALHDTHAPVSTEADAPADEPVHEVTVLPHHGVDRLSDKELCRAWRDSFRALLDAIEPGAKCGVVRLRQSYLEELERRHPDALGAWLASHPRPSAGPEKYLGSAGDDRDAA
jgi:hypothetical protein